MNIFSMQIFEISDEEVEFIFGKKILKKIQIIYLIKVSNCQFLLQEKMEPQHTQKNVVANSKGIKVNAVDTTGAGDGFIGCLLYQMAKENVDLEQINILTEEQLKTYLDLSNKFCSISVTKEGAIASYPTMEELR